MNRKPLLQFRLRTLFIVTTITCVLLAYFAFQFQRAAERRQVLSMLTQRFAQIIPEGCVTPVEANVSYGGEYIVHPVPTVYGELVAPTRVHGIVSRFEEFSDDDLKLIGGVRELRYLRFRGANVTDAGLAHLIELRELQSFSLVWSKITDEGVSQLVHFPNLICLEIPYSHVTNACLPHVAELRKLRYLSAGGTKISDEGLAVVATMTELRDLSLSDCPIQGHGLKYLAQLPRLTLLDLSYTAVDDDDIRQLAACESLQRLIVFDTSVTAAGAEELERLNPHLQVEWNLRSSSRAVNHE